MNTISIKVYLFGELAGYLSKLPGEQYVFTYDRGYLASGKPKLSYTLPLQEAPFVSVYKLHSFFDNLIAEGWLKNAQARALNISPENRFELLATFGHDLIGAVTLVSDYSKGHLSLDIGDAIVKAALKSRFSLSGVQPKLPVIQEGRRYLPAPMDRPSTHIAKFSSLHLPNLVENEFLATCAFKTFLPKEDKVEVQVGEVEGMKGKCLMVKRFDRTSSGSGKIHFEEFNQLLNQQADEKYEGDIAAMAKFIRTTEGCIPAEAEKLFRRILVFILIGNTDTHFKNFALFHEGNGYRLTPAYDIVSAALYPDYQIMALDFCKAKNLKIKTLKSKHILALAKAFGLSDKVIHGAVKEIGQKMVKVFESIDQVKEVQGSLKKQLKEFIKKRWDRTFQHMFQAIGQSIGKK